MSKPIAIIGAGIIGLLTARELLRHGKRVHIVDCSLPGREASWAGGGIVSPLYPWHYDAAITALARDATTAHAQLAAALRTETGIDPQFNPCGLLMLDPPEMAEALAWSRRNRRRAIPCDPDAMRLVQTGVGDAQQGLWFPEIGNVRNPRLLQALLAVVTTHPYATCSWRAQVELRATGGGELRVNGEVVQAEHIAVCAGAWSAALLKPFGVDLPIVPVRGQMLLYPPQPGLLRCIVLRKGRYLIPRRDGRIVAGSTLEHTGFLCETTREAGTQLHASATRMLPALAQIEPEAQWAGLRPGAPAGIPFIDWLPGGRVLVNAGHFRNGLVLAPAAAALGVALLLGDRTAVDPEPYRITAPRGTTLV